MARRTLIPSDCSLLSSFKMTHGCTSGKKPTAAWKRNFGTVCCCELQTEPGKPRTCAGSPTKGTRSLSQKRVAAHTRARCQSARHNGALVAADAKTDATWAPRATAIGAARDGALLAQWRRLSVGAAGVGRRRLGGARARKLRRAALIWTEMSCA